MLGRRRAAQQVLDLDASDAIGVQGPIEEIVHGRDCADIQPVGDGRVHTLSDRPTGGTRHGDEEHLRPGLGHGIAQCVIPP